MLLFNLYWTPVDGYELQGFNTSHVTVQLTMDSVLELVRECFNTSHVTVQL